jgi:hypothetical protein
MRRFSVRVPVLSLQRTSIPAISSIAVIFFIMAPFKNENNMRTIQALVFGFDVVFVNGRKHEIDLFIFLVNIRTILKVRKLFG